LAIKITFLEEREKKLKNHFLTHTRWQQKEDVEEKEDGAEQLKQLTAFFK
jgi:hypothetical protein